MGSNRKKTDDPWLKTGRHKLGFNVEHRQLEDAGSFTGGGLKTLWHTTEGGNVDSVLNTLASKRAAVHFVIDPKSGRTVQCIGFDQAGRGLGHVFPPETNRANVIQIEIVGFASQSGSWGDREYKNLARLGLAIERHFGTPRTVRSFTKPVKFTADQFVAFAGHCGHCHVPGNDHWDPGPGFKGRVLINHMKGLDK